MLGPRELPRLWERHLLNCGVLKAVLPDRSTVLDLGSGAGLPGVVLALLRPDCFVTLLEPMERRAVFLQTVVTELQLNNAVVARQRAEAAVGLVSADIVTARAVAPLDILAGWGLPLVNPGGRMLAIKGRTAAKELTASTRALRRAGAVSWEVQHFGVGVLVEPTTVVTIVRGTATPKQNRTRPAVHRTARGPKSGGRR